MDSCQSPPTVNRSDEKVKEISDDLHRIETDYIRSLQQQIRYLELETEYLRRSRDGCHDAEPRPWTCSSDVTDYRLSQSAGFRHGQTAVGPSKVSPDRLRRDEMLDADRFGAVPDREKIKVRTDENYGLNAAADGDRWNVDRERLKVGSAEVIIKMTGDGKASRASNGDRCELKADMERREVAVDADKLDTTLKRMDRFKVPSDRGSPGVDSFSHRSTDNEQTVRRDDFMLLGKAGEHSRDITQSPGHRSGDRAKDTVRSSPFQNDERLMDKGRYPSYVDKRHLVGVSKEPSGQTVVPFSQAGITSGRQNGERLFAETERRPGSQNVEHFSGERSLGSKGKDVVPRNSAVFPDRAHDRRVINHTEDLALMSNVPMRDGRNADRNYNNRNVMENESDYDKLSDSREFDLYSESSASIDLPYVVDNEVDAAIPGRFSKSGTSSMSMESEVARSFQGESPEVVLRESPRWEVGWERGKTANRGDHGEVTRKTGRQVNGKNVEAIPGMEDVPVRLERAEFPGNLRNNPCKSGSAAKIYKSGTAGVPPNVGHVSEADERDKRVSCSRNVRTISPMVDQSRLVGSPREVQSNSRADQESFVDDPRENQSRPVGSPKAQLDMPALVGSSMADQSLHRGGRWAGIMQSPKADRDEANDKKADIILVDAQASPRIDSDKSESSTTVHPRDSDNRSPFVEKLAVAKSAEADKKIAEIETMPFALDLQTRSASSPNGNLIAAKKTPRISPVRSEMSPKLDQGNPDNITRADPTCPPITSAVDKVPATVFPIESQTAGDVIRDVTGRPQDGEEARVMASRSSEGTEEHDSNMAAAMMDSKMADSEQALGQHEALTVTSQCPGLPEISQSDIDLSVTSLRQRLVEIAASQASLAAENAVMSNRLARLSALQECMEKENAALSDQLATLRGLQQGLEGENRRLSLDNEALQLQAKHTQIELESGQEIISRLRRQMELTERKLKPLERLREVHGGMDASRWEEFCRFADGMKGVSECLAQPGLEPGEHNSI